MSYFGVSLRNGVGLGLGTVPSLTNTPLSYRLAPSLDLSFAGSDALSPAITFSRTTNATLTNSAGLVANAPMNLLTFSEQFDNSYWGKIEATVSANQIAAPDGTFTADKILTTAVNSVHVVFKQSVVSSGAVTLSVYAKAGEYSWLFMGDTNSTNNGANFNLATGVLGTIGSNATATITPAGNGWYRCTVATTASAGSGIGLYVQNANNVITFAGNATSGIYVWGAQLEVGSTATTYNPTTVKNLLGFTENFDNAAWTKSNAFVQTNLLTYSQNFDDAAWTKTATTVTANTEVAPDGTTTAEKAVATATASTYRWVRQSFSSFVSGVTYTFSVFAKSSEYTKVYLSDANAGSFACAFDLTAGTAGTPSGGFTGLSASITNVGGGWYRCSLTFTANASGGRTPSVVGYPNSGVTLDTYGAQYAGDGTSGALFWGAQLVQGTSAGDYKATYAAAAAVGYTDIYGQPFAQKLVENTANAARYAQGTHAAVTGPATISFYAKAGERTFAMVFLLGVNNSVAWFNLADGVIGGTQSAGPTSYSITPVGSGWYRCVATYSAAPTNNVCIGFSTANNTFNYTGDGTSGIYIFGAQLSDSASVDPYVYQPVAAPTSTAYYGPRFDYDPVTLAPKGLLIEEQRTNLVTYSEQFDNAAWTKQTCVVVANALAAPDGTITGDKLVSNSGVSGNLFRSTTLTASSYTQTVYAKAGEWSWLMLGATLVGNAGVWFNLTTGVVGTVNAGFTGQISSVGNGWYRCSITFTATAVPWFSIIFQTNVDGSFSSGDGTSGIYVWGAQLEAGAFATSYIPTVASQVTRAADSASMIGNNFARWYNQTEGTLFGQASSAFIPASTAYGIATVRSTSANAIGIGLQADLNASASIIRSGDVTQAIFGAATANNQTYKMGLAYATNNAAFSIGGAAVQTDATVVLPVVDALYIGQVRQGTIAGTEHIQRIAYYPRRLANTELQGITS